MVTGILAMLLSLLGNIGAAALTWLSPQLALVLFVLISLVPIAFSLWQARQKAAAEPSAAEARENRQIMLSRVQNTWITGLLENELYYDKELLPLGLCRRVGDPWDPVLQNPLEPAAPLPLGTKISEVFDQADGKLLILGEPGAGKTTLLLELARDLLERAKNKENHPIPVLLMLSSWTTKQLPLEQWVIEELKTKYDIPSQIGQTWVEASQLLLLLAGLDEVAPSAQSVCIEAVNKYAAQAHKSIVICSRTKEYLDQSGRLSLRTVVSIQPLSSLQIEDYLLTLGEYVSGLKSALQQSETLRALATTPLFLKVLILTYHGKSTLELLPLVKTAPADQQHVLFHNYVERMLQKDGPRLHATAQQTKHWLVWLAHQLTAHHQTELYLERLQLDWLPKGQRAFYRWSIRLLFGLLSGLRGGLVCGLACGLVFGLFSGLVFGLRVGLRVGLVFGLVFGLSAGLGAGLLIGLLIGLLFFGLGVGSSGKQLTERSILSPNEGIRRSVKNGLVFGLVFGLLGGLGGGLLGGLGGGLLGGLVFGLDATLLHYTLRFWLWRTHLFPRQAVPFLDDTVEQLLLRKVGGGYVFRHRLLQDYFASLDVGPPHDPSFRAEAHPVLQNATNGDPSL